MQEEGARAQGFRRNKEAAARYGLLRHAYSLPLFSHEWPGLVF